MDGVEEAKYGQDVIEHLFAITRLIRIFGLVLMVLLAGATLFIISNTIRLTVFARRKEIAIMKYVGDRADGCEAHPVVAPQAAEDFLDEILTCLQLHTHTPLAPHRARCGRPRLQ